VVDGRHVATPWTVITAIAAMGILLECTGSDRLFVTLVLTLTAPAIGQRSQGLSRDSSDQGAFVAITSRPSLHNGWRVVAVETLTVLL